MRPVEAQLRTIAGRAVHVGEITITPYAQTLTVRGPFGGFVWNRPVAIEIERAGQVKRIRVVDVTRIAQLGVLASVLVLAVYGAATLARRRE